MEEELDLSVFEKAIISFSDIIKRYKKEKNDDAVRDAVIQRFEYTYILAIKMIKRYLKLSSSAEENINIEVMDFGNLIRTADKMELLLNGLEQWSEYRLKRNITSHTYDEDKALEVISIIDTFEAEVKHLLAELKKRFSCEK